MNVTLRPEIEKFVEEKLRAGQYESASEVVNDAIAALMGQEHWDASDIEELRADVKMGIDEHCRGESTLLDMEAIKAMVRRPFSSEQS